MRKYTRVGSILLLLLLLTGCTTATTEDVDRIGRPSNDTLLLEGTWKIESRVGNNGEAEEPVRLASSVVGEEMSFSKSAMVFSNNYWSEVGYKVKRVNVNEYFLHKDSNVLQEFETEGNEALVLTAYSQDKFLYEFVRVSDDRMIVNIDEQYYSMKKISGEFSGAAEVIAGALDHPEAEDINNQERLIRSGLLLGIRTPVKTNGEIDDFTYRTYWISGINQVFRPVLSAKDIYLPRMDGFWRLKIEKVMGGEGTEDILTASMVNKRTEKLLATSAENYSKRLETKLRSAVIYVGNDYVCVENTVRGNEQNTTASAIRKTIRTLPVDNLANIEGIKLYDLVGENGTLAMESAFSDLLKNSGYNGFVNMDEADLQESFALYRKTGHWFFKGRLNLSSAGPLPYIDFSLNLIPPANMVAYDILQVPWTEVKDKIPQAVDVYTSPNKDIAVVVTRNSILLYPIEGKTLAAQPSAKLPLTEGSSVIMAEWAVGDYVLSWERSFVKNNETTTEASPK
jgi:hypothetical protein